MNVEALNIQDISQFQANRPAGQVETARKKVQSADAPEEAPAKQVQPEEMLQQIKALTEDGLYSVRFENDNDAGELVVKVVDRETDEVIRQIPPEELLDLTKRLQDLRGNIVDTQS